MQLAPLLPPLLTPGEWEPHLWEAANILPLDVAIADFKATLERVREAEENLRRVMNEGGWLEQSM